PGLETRHPVAAERYEIRLPESQKLVEQPRSNETAEQSRAIEPAIPGPLPLENKPEQARPAGDAAEINTAFLPRRHFGTVFQTYILAEGDGEFYIVDQHTAHERINYERKRRALLQRECQRQALLVPQSIECTVDEKERYLEHADQFAAAGFLIEEYGPGTIVVREVPDYISAADTSEILQHLLQRLLDGEDAVTLYDDYTAMKACKASIKKNDHVAGGVLSSILAELARCENPARCPHGRPTMMRITQAELDRLFHRS
ncbi:MAG: hypothetical protein KDK39_07630, partial [Leptospiraceae bacterium]|nr:hypothetical protein [Leptospiraceae bacterium]